MSSISIALDLIGRDLTGPAFAGVLGKINALKSDAALNNVADEADNAAQKLKVMTGALLGGGLALAAFTAGLHLSVDAAGQLDQATTMAAIAISDGTQHIKEIEDAIVSLANTSIFKIADVDLAFRILGERGFTTAQILNGLGQESIYLAEALGVDAVDGATLLGQAFYLFQGQGLSTKQMADQLTGAFYNNMNSASSLTQFLSMTGGTAVALGTKFDDLLVMGDLLTPMFGSASSAGASLAYMMRNLAHPATSKMADEIKHLGLQIYDSQGNFVGLQNIMDQLFTKMKGMTEQQKMDVIGTLFNVRSGRAAMDLLSETQQQFDSTYARVKSRIDQVGQTTRDANLVTNTWNGTTQRLSTTFNDFLAKSGLLITGALKPILNHINDLLSAAQKNPTIVKFFSAFLVAGAALSIVTVLVVAFVMFGTVLAVAGAVFAGLVAGAAALAAGFVLVTSHTKQLHAAWTAITGFLTSTFGPAFRGIVDTVKDIWGAVMTQLQPALNDLKFVFGDLQNRLQQAQPLWNALAVVLKVSVGAAIGVVALAIGGLIAFIGALVGAFTGAFGGIVMIVTGAIHMVVGSFTLMVDALSTIWNALVALFTGHANMVGSILHDGFSRMGEDVVSILHGMAQMAVGVIVGLGGAIIGAIEGLVRGVVGWFQHLADILVGHSIVPDMMLAIVGWFARAPGMALSAISGLTGMVMGVFQGLENQVLGLLGRLASQLLSSGAHMVQNLAAGIRGAIGSVTSAVGSVAGAIANFLKHSKPAEGPLSDDDEWGGHLVHNIANGMTGNLHVLHAASGAVAGTIAAGIHTPSIAASAASSGSRGGTPQQIIIPVYVGSKQVAEAVFDTLKGTLQQNGMSRAFR